MSSPGLLLQEELGDWWPSSVDEQAPSSHGNVLQGAGMTHLCELFSFQYIIMKNLIPQKNVKNGIVNILMPTT